VAELCVIFNPASGKHRGRRRLEQVRRDWGAAAAFWPTQAPGDAVALAERAALAGYHIVAAAGGDGTVHEVVNGLMRSGRSDVRFALLPIGSANDYAFSLGLTRRPTEEPGIRQVDVGRVAAPGGRERFFACNIGMGLSGAVTWESRRIRRLQGIALYGLATLRALVNHYRIPLMDVQLDDAPVARLPTLLLSVLNGKREGGFELAPQAQLDDGRLDFVHAGDLSRWQVLRLLLRLAVAGAPADYPGVRQQQCRHVRIRSDELLRVHTDGEFFCLPEDGVCELDIAVLPGALTVALDLGR
jgi:diacylglycerol kinase family enzyme